MTLLVHSGTKFCCYPTCNRHVFVPAGFTVKCSLCEDWFHNADHSDCMARHQREVHGVEWCTPNVAWEVRL